MKAEIISVGTEILLGEILDTNAGFIASRLPAIGLDLYFKQLTPTPLRAFDPSKEGSKGHFQPRRHGNL